MKFITPLPGWRRTHDQCAAIADCTRLRVLRIYARCNQRTAIQFVDYVLERLPFRVEVIQTDNGVEFGSRFHWHALDRRRPWLPQAEDAPAEWQGRALHRIDAEEFYRLLDGVVIDDAEVFNDKLGAWEDFCNDHRPHGSLDGQTPMKDSSNEPRPERKQPPSVAQWQ